MENRPIHIVRALRERIGLTRAQLASLTGISVALLRKIEDNQRDLSRPVAWRIAIQTGLDVTELQRGMYGRLPDQITRESYLARNEQPQTVEPGRVDSMVDSFCFRIQQILDTAALGSPAKLNVTWYALHVVLDQLETDLGLHDQVLSLRRHYRDLWHAQGIPIAPIPKERESDQHDTLNGPMATIVSKDREDRYQERAEIIALKARAKASKKRGLPKA